MEEENRLRRHGSRETKWRRKELQESVH